MSRCIYKNEDYCNRCNCMISEVKALVPGLQCEKHCPYSALVYEGEQVDDLIMKFYKKFYKEDILMLAKRLYYSRLHTVCENDVYDLLKKAAILAVIKSGKGKLILNSEELLEAFEIVKRIPNRFNIEEQFQLDHCA